MIVSKAIGKIKLKQHLSKTSSMENRVQKDENSQTAALIDSINGYLNSLHRFGVTSLPIPTGRPVETVLEGHSKTGAESTATEADSAVVKEAAQEDLKGYSVAEMNTKTKRTTASCAEQLAVLKNEVAACTRCKELADSRTQTVFGVGNPNPRLVIVGEAPGANEDKQGEPFVGRAGQLLDKILEACKLKRSDVFILNTIKCRPPSNRNPSDVEISNCWDFALRQLDVLQPEFICCVGGIAAKTVLDTKLAIGRLRGQMHDFNGIPVMVTYHPAYLLRNPDAKKLVWEDMKMLMREMGTPVD